MTNRTYLIGPILNSIIWFGTGMEYEKLRPKIGRWIGVAHTCGRSMKYFILTDRGKVIINTTLQHQTATEVQHPEVQKLIKDYHEIINAEIGKVVVY